jgi:hypothetical protein
MRGEFEPKIENKPEKPEDNLKKSSIKKIIGNVDEERKEEIQKELAKRFNKQEFEGLKEKEIKKTPEQIEIIKLINDETNKLLKKYYLPKFDITPNNVHILKGNDYEKFKPGISWATFEKNFQSVFVNKEKVKTNLNFACINFHEFVHFKALQSLREYKEELNTYQSGLEIYLKSQKIIFSNLNEAVTEKLTKKFYNNILKKHPLFKKRIKENKKIIKHKGDKYIKSIANDIYDSYEENIFLPNGRILETTIHYSQFCYSEQRKILNTLIEKLYSKNTDQFKNKEEVFDIFAKSAFTGKLNWGKLVNKTFGKGTFKKLAQLDENVEELGKFVENLE